MQSQNDRKMMEGYRRVAFVEEFWDIFQKQIHNFDGLHAGVYRRRLHGYVTDIYCIHLAGLLDT